MTTEELIQGHFDGTLVPAEERALVERLAASSEVRGMLEGHRLVEGLLTQEAAALAPSAALDEAVIAASLGAVPETVSGGGGLWIGAKIAAGVVVTGLLGIGSFFLATSGSSEGETGAIAPPAPQVITNVSPAVAPVPVTEPSVAAPSPRRTTVPAVKEQTRKTPTASRPERRQERGRPSTSSVEKKEELRLDRTPDNSVRHQPRITPQDGK